MASNLRAKPIQGHITDSAGNVLRNSQIVIKQFGNFVVDTIISNDDGYFISRPIPNGQYDIYESGVLVSRVVHTADRNSIQCFAVQADNYFPEEVSSFDTLLATPELNSFKHFIQIESDDVDVEIYGSSYPIYDFILSDSVISNQLKWLADFYTFNTNSRITTARFDVEYFAPLTNLSKTYRRIRWVGVPAIRFREDSKLVIPLDYYSIVANMPKVISSSIPATDVTIVTPSTWDFVTVEDQANSTEFADFIRGLAIGDIVKLDIGGPSTAEWWGIFTSRPNTTKNTIVLERWRSSNYTSHSSGTPSNYHVSRLRQFNGMFQGITALRETVNERFTVVENVYAQGQKTELYSYPSS